MKWRPHAKVIERVPADKFDYKPHEKSMTMGRLACHIAEMPGWVRRRPSARTPWIMSGGYKPSRRFGRARIARVLRQERAPLARAAIAGASDETSMQTWVAEERGTTT